MNGYEIIISTPTYHNELFIGHIRSYMTVHAETESEARAMVNLQQKTSHRVHEDLSITQEEQTIYSVKCLGRVVTRTIIEYEPI